MKVIIALVSMAVSAIANAQPVLFQEGVHYQAVQSAPQARSSGVEVVEVFGYLCPHCASFQPHIHPWSQRLGAGVSFKRIPVVFRPSWEPLARAYYTAEALGVLEQSHPALFDALHRQRQALRSNQQLAEFFKQFGVSAEEYLKTANSSEVDKRVIEGMQLSQQYGVTGTPSVVVNGKYITSGVMTGSYPVLLEVVDFLIDLESSTQTKGQ